MSNSIKIKLQYPGIFSQHLYLQSWGLITEYAAPGRSKTHNSIEVAVREFLESQTQLNNARLIAEKICSVGMFDGLNHSVGAPVGSWGVIRFDVKKEHADMCKEKLRCEFPNKLIAQIRSELEIYEFQLNVSKILENVNFDLDK